MSSSTPPLHKPERNPPNLFTISVPSSLNPSRVSSPTPIPAFKSNAHDLTTNSPLSPSASPFQTGPISLNEKKSYYNGSDGGKASTYWSEKHVNGNLHPNSTLRPAGQNIVPGRLATDVYDATLPWWRAAIRRKLLKNVEWESRVLARMQDRIRTPWLDAYFVYTSSLGTHTFFMTVLPALFFFGYEEMGRGLLIVLALGVYCSSVVKDLICSPRPFAPPVTRLTIGSHHLEYGFPSTHSTNSVSIALFFFSHVHRLASSPPSIPDSLLHPSSLNSTEIASSVTRNMTSNLAELTLDPALSPTTYTVLTVLLTLYTFSIVFGRLYTAMHSFTDCVMGVAMGAGIWWAHSSWSGIPLVLADTSTLASLFSILGFGAPGEMGTRVLWLGKGLGAGEWVEEWVRRGGWEVPLILIPVCLLAVNQHPQPVDDCPCFEDAIAFGSVVLGALVGRWGMRYAGVGLGIGRTAVMPGSGWVFDGEMGKWVGVERGWEDVAVWWGVAAVKMVVGILVIFTWRLLAKSMLHLILPPTFRFLSRVSPFRLPNRRFYTPATDYKSVPSEFGPGSRGGGFGLRPIPSVIDLPGTGGVGVEVGGIGTGSGVGGLRVGGGVGWEREIKMRGTGAGGGEKGRAVNGGGNGYIDGYANGGERGGEGKDGEPVKHYDADVLTKVIVYSGIAVLACEVMPVMFEVLGWGVKSWM